MDDHFRPFGSSEIEISSMMESLQSQGQDPFRRPSETEIKQRSALTRFTLPNVSRTFSSLELGSPFNCFTGMPGMRQSSREELKIEISDKQSLTLETKSVLSTEDIRKYLNISAGCFLKSFTSQVKISTLNAFCKQFESAKERKWFFCECRYEKTAETLIGKPPNLDEKSLDDTHYVSSILKGGALLILYTSDNVSTLDEATKLVSQDNNIMAEVGISLNTSSDSSSKKTSFQDLIYIQSTLLGSINISNVAQIKDEVEKFTTKIALPDTPTVPLMFEMLPISTKAFPHVQVNVSELENSWKDILDAQSELEALQKQVTHEDQATSTDLIQRKKEIGKLQEEFQNLFRHLHTIESVVLENDAWNVLERYKNNLGNYSTLKDKVDAIKKDALSTTTAALSRMIPIKFNNPFEASREDFTIVLVGKTGSGKSSFGNLLAGKAVFKVDSHAEAVTKERQSAKFTVGGQTMTVWDTPGFYDPHKDHALALKELKRIYKGVREGIHTIALVVRFDAFMDAQKVYKKIKNKHPYDVLKYIVLVFTHVKDQGVNELVEDRFKPVAIQVKNRALAVREQSLDFNNKEEQKAIRSAFLNIVKDVYTDNGGRPCTNLVSSCMTF